MLVDRPPLEFHTNGLIDKGKSSCNVVTPREDGPFRIARVQQHTLIVDKNGFRNAMLIDRDMWTPSNGETAHEREGSDCNGDKGVEPALEASDENGNKLILEWDADDGGSNSMHLPKPNRRVKISRVNPKQVNLYSVLTRKTQRNTHYFERLQKASSTGSFTTSYDGTK